MQVIGLYLLCLLAAFFTWIAVMYAEEKAAEKEAAKTDDSAQTLCLPTTAEREQVCLEDGVSLCYEYA